MAFQARWREHACAGWKSQQSKGLPYDIIYIMPGKKKRDGVHGRDYCEGEEELMKYLDRMDLEELKELQAQQRSKSSKGGGLSDTHVIMNTERPSTQSSDDKNSVPPTHGDISDAHPGEVSVYLDAAPATLTSSSAHADIIHGVSPHDTTYESGGIDSAEEDDNDASALATSPHTRRNLDDDFADADESPSTTPGRQPHLEQAATLDEEAKEDSSRPDTGPSGGVDQLAFGNMPSDLLRDMTKTGWYPLEKQTPYEYLIEPYEPRPASAMQDDYPRLYDGPYGPTEGACVLQAHR
ncbi:hypothetical protein PC115_g19669 [Phytophthora cactorum]|uniref:Uncharacterized protein n=1 Tax=Phytophthora cactorum TaxID=29920 RepID=A0A8T1AZ58_9STRA|nr:hypothetical protein PC115_g19669 [Phytophthora cactorum]